MRTPLWLVLGLVCLGSSPAYAQSVLGLNVGVYSDDGDLAAEEQASIQTIDESFAYASDGFLSGSLYVLKQWTPSMRLGGQISYYGTHTASVTNEDDNNDDEQLYEFGRLVELSARLEYLIPATETVDIMLGGMFGFPVLFPDGDFQAEIDRLVEQEADVLDLPRLGYLISPVVGGRWRYSDHLFFRADLMFKWEQIFLFRTTGELQETPYRKTWTTSTVRSELTMGLEVVL